MPRPRAMVAKPRRVPIAIRAGMLPWVPFWLSLGIGGWFLLRDEPGPGFYAALVLVGGACLLLPGLALRWAERGRLGWDWADRCRIASLALLLVALGAGLAGARAHLVAAPGIIGNVMTYEHGGKQYVGVLSGVGGWAGIGLAAGLTNPNEGLGAVGGYAALSQYTELGGQLTVFELPG